jgi:murein DD-endopeptidase MepM/ murein hydrolase activator NlpD
MQRDFKSQLFDHKANRSRKREPVLFVVLGLALTLILVATAPSIATATRGLIPQGGNEQVAESVRQNISNDLSLTADPDNESSTDSGEIDTATAQETLHPGKWHSETIHRGDSLSTVFDRVGLPPAQLLRVMAAGDDSAQLRRLHPGDNLQLYTSQDNRLLRGLIYKMSETRRLEIIQSGDDLSSRIITTPLETRLAHATGTINSSLFLASQKAGLSDNLTMELANLFGWDIDFVLDIRQGDKFSVIYEEQYLHGDKLRDGHILAAEFVNRGHSFRAVRFTDANGHSGYYTPDGKSVRKAFLRTPVAFSRISSRFSLGRKHPILNRIRAHKGVDYAAPRGTPIKATGDGKVIYRGRKGGYGNVVILQHGSKYSTLYGHMSRFARGVHSGGHVRQGQIIGYVGMTGLATGPHLHYEFRVNGVHRNPLTVALPDAAPLPRRYMSSYNETASPLLAQLDTLKRTTLALNSP